MTYQALTDLRQCTDDICATSQYLGNGYLAVCQYHADDFLKYTNSAAKKVV